MLSLIQSTETNRKQWNDCRLLTGLVILYCKLQFTSSTRSTSKQLEQAVQYTYNGTVQQMNLSLLVTTVIVIIDS